MNSTAVCAYHVLHAYVKHARKYGETDRTTKQAQTTQTHVYSSLLAYAEHIPKAISSLWEESTRKCAANNSTNNGILVYQVHKYVHH